MSGRERRTIHRGRIIDLGIETAHLPDGRAVELEIVRHPGGAAIVALDRDRHVCLLSQYRHAAGGWIRELPAGRLEPGEPALDTARRELAEEAGVTAGEWTDLGTMLSTPGFCDEVLHLFLARDLRPVGTRHEASEAIEVHWLPFADALRMAADGDITDAKSVVALFRAAGRLGEDLPGTG